MMLMLESSVVVALNHLLEAEPWARARLAPFAGETCELRVAPLPALRFQIAEDGTLVRSDGEARITLTLTLGSEALPALLRGEDHFMRSIEVSGNARLASEVLFLVRNLRWDVEDDLASWIGDALAHRLVRSAGGVAAWHKDAATRVTAGLMDYVIEEKRLLVRRPELAIFGRELAALRDALERIELRLARLGG